MPVKNGKGFVPKFVRIQWCDDLKAMRNFSGEWGLFAFIEPMTTLTVDHPHRTRKNPVKVGYLVYWFHFWYFRKQRRIRWNWWFAKIGKEISQIEDTDTWRNRKDSFGWRFAQKTKGVKNVPADEHCQITQVHLMFYFLNSCFFQCRIWWTAKIADNIASGCTKKDGTIWDSLMIWLTLIFYVNTFILVTFILSYHYV